MNAKEMCKSVVDKKVQVILGWIYNKAEYDGKEIILSEQLYYAGDLSGFKKESNSTEVIEYPGVIKELESLGYEVEKYETDEKRDWEHEVKLVSYKSYFFFKRKHVELDTNKVTQYFQIKHYKITWCCGEDV